MYAFRRMISSGWIRFLFDIAKIYLSNATSSNSVLLKINSRRKLILLFAIQTTSSQQRDQLEEKPANDKFVSFVSRKNLVQFQTFSNARQQIHTRNLFLRVTNGDIEGNDVDSWKSEVQYVTFLRVYPCI